eukprot:jgi/Tetstr1/449582/TSEL_036669.t1
MAPRQRVISAVAGILRSHRGPAWATQAGPASADPAVACWEQLGCVWGQQPRRALGGLCAAATWLTEARAAAHSGLRADGTAVSARDSNLLHPYLARGVTPSGRHYAGHGSSEEPDSKLAADYLQTSAAITMREDLKRVAATRNVIPLAEMLQICQESGVATTDADAREYYRALQKTGVVIGAGKWVYLRPKEVISTVQRYIPHTAEEISLRVQELERQLAPMMKEKRQIECTAEQRSKRFLYATLLAMIAQYSIILRLTYFEFSWDVMEPIAYFATGGTSIACLIYYLVFRTPFEYSEVANQWKNQYIYQSSFDHEQFSSLTRELESYRRSLHSMRLSDERSKQE